MVRRLALILALCAAWTSWKAAVLLLCPHASSWRHLLNHVEASSLSFIVVYYAWVLWALKVLAGRYRKEVSLRSITLGLLLALPLTVLLYVLRGSPDPLVVLLTAVTFSVFGGIVEEVIYRGLLLDVLMEELDPVRAIILQSILFGLSHPWSWETVIGATLFGAPLAILRLRVGIGCCIAFHWLVNVTAHA